MRDNRGNRDCYCVLAGSPYKWVLLSLVSAMFRQVAASTLLGADNRRNQACVPFTLSQQGKKFMNPLSMAKLFFNVWVKNVHIKYIYLFGNFSRVLKFCFPLLLQFSHLIFVNNFFLKEIVISPQRRIQFFSMWKYCLVSCTPGSIFLPVL